MTAAFTRYIDVAQVSLYIFWGFFAGLVFYLQRESKREGYPLVNPEDPHSVRGPIEGFPLIPAPKKFLWFNGNVSYAPQTVPADGPVVGAVPVAAFPGAPLTPTGNPLVDGIGPASWCMRRDEPELTWEGHIRMVPMRLMTGYQVSRYSDDPHDWPVVGADGHIAGHVRDIWMDNEEKQIRYLEIELSTAVAPGAHRVLVPEPFVRYRPRRQQVSVRAILAHQFADVPTLRDPDQITAREEERLIGYFGGGSLYATPGRLGPLL